MNKDDLKHYIENNPKLVTMRESTTYPGLFVLKYKRNVFYDGLWNEYLEECRGTVVDKDFNIVSYPFTKIYNFGVEKHAPIINDDQLVTAYRKVNGFMVSLSYHNNDIVVSTTGSLDSEYVQYAKEMMLTHATWEHWRKYFALPIVSEFTHLFECVHPNDPHIIPEKQGMYLLGFRRNLWTDKVNHFDDSESTTLSEVAKKLNCFHAEHCVTSMGEVKMMAKQCKHEGFVIYTPDGRSTKIKSPYYLFSKFVARKSSEKLSNILENKENYKTIVEEEYYPIMEHLLKNKDIILPMDEQQRLEYIRNYMGA